MKTNHLLAALSICIACPIFVYGQTTLSGDHIITGDLNVGTSGTNGNLEVSGETGGSAAPGIKVTGDGGVLFEGTYGTGQIPAEGAGTRFMWYPKKAALRVGRAESTEWDDASIGLDSIALGYSAIAASEGAVSLGAYSFAGGEYSLAGAAGFIGSWEEASFSAALASGTVMAGESSFAAAAGQVAEGQYAVALGNGYAAGTCAFAASRGDALGIGSVAMSEGMATGEASTALSFGGSGGYGSVAMSLGQAIGSYSIAGNGGSAYGDNSVAFGEGTFASSAYSAAFGRYNADPNNFYAENATGWDEDNSLFVVGNGTGNPSDGPEVRYRKAFAIYKNGNITIPKRQGDILMGEFGNPE